MTAARRNALGLVAVAVFLCLILALAHEPILRNAGEFLVEDQGPEKADAILVLAGDMRGLRIMRAGELVRSGYAPVALVSGPYDIYGVNEAELAIQFAVRKGVPAAYFEPLRLRALSTNEEAQAYVPELRKRNIRKLLLVTSDYHTRRAGETFRRVLGSDVQVRTVAAPDPFFAPGSWWHNREGQKTVFFEYSKTLASWVGL